MGGVQVGRGRIGVGESSVNGGDGESLLSKLPPPFLENIDRRSYNAGSRELIPVFHSPHVVVQQLHNFNDCTEVQIWTLLELRRLQTIIAEISHSVYLSLIETTSTCN